MVRILRATNMVLLALAVFAFAVRANAADVDCSQFNIDVMKADPPPGTTPPATCNVRMSNGFPLPNRTCTPGAVNPTVTVAVLRNPEFRTSCLRGLATTETQKARTYARYGIPHPDHNTGVMQICELDHLISLELGGADTIENIWPQCGPENVALIHRYFKQKDIVENFLARQVREGVLDLKEVQRGVSDDWTQYLDDAEADCKARKCKSNTKGE
jgi:hypothetical protein